MLVLAPPYPTLKEYVHSPSGTSCVSTGNVRGASAKYSSKHCHIYGDLHTQPCMHGILYLLDCSYICRCIVAPMHGCSLHVHVHTYTKLTQMLPPTCTHVTPHVHVYVRTHTCTHAHMHTRTWVHRSHWGNFI